jgi:hypothetical protein
MPELSEENGIQVIDSLEVELESLHKSLRRLRQMDMVDMVEGLDAATMDTIKTYWSKTTKTLNECQTSLVSLEGLIRRVKWNSEKWALGPVTRDAILLRLQASEPNFNFHKQRLAASREAISIALRVIDLYFPSEPTSVLTWQFCATQK